VVLSLLCASQPEITERIIGTIYTDAASNVLTRESEIILKDVADTLRDKPNLMIDVYGYSYSASSFSRNLDQSQRMADQAGAYLISNMNIAPSRIQTSGLGSKERPISPSGEKSMERSNRVEFAIRQPEAVLTWFENDVKVQPPALRPAWLTPLPNYYLYHDYKVTTGAQSSAHILYPGKGMLRMDEDAMVVIHSLSLAQKEKPPLGDIRLQHGSLAAILNNIEVQADSITRTIPDNELASQKDDMIVVGKLEDLVVVFQENADVADIRPQNVEFIDISALEENADTPDEPVVPPLVPRLVSPEMNETKYYPSEITFLWQPGEALSHLQVAEDSLFEQLAFDEYTARDSLSTTLTKNRYYWRVSGINEDSLESNYAEYWTFVVENDTTKPLLEITLSRDAKQNMVIASGRTEAGAQLFIDNERAKIDVDGSFSYSILRDQHRDHVVVRAVDAAGNITERTYRIPDTHVFVMGINAGVCLVTSDGGSQLENGFWYGFQFSRMLRPSLSFFMSSTIARSNARIEDVLNTTDIAVFDIGIRKNFTIGQLSPFLYVRSGFGFSQNNTTSQITPGTNEDWSLLDPTFGFGIGSWFDINGNWFINIHADYTRVFSMDNDSQQMRSFTKIGFGIQDRML
jgi:hypothetical protein